MSKDLIGGERRIAGGVAGEGSNSGRADKYKGPRQLHAWGV